MSNTLTIMDVVNKFKGELIFSFEHLCYSKASNEYFAIKDLANIDGDEYFICYVLQLKDLIKELETNFGRSYSYQQYKFVFKQMTSEAKAKPVFTQAMADAWELPKVGMMVNHLSVKKEVILPADSNDKYVLKSDSLGCYALALLNEIKPIDTRTDKEKAIDDLLDKSVIFCNKDTMRTCFKIAYDEWAAKSDE